MKRASSVEGLRKNAQKKRTEAFEKVDKGIKQLITEKRVINFNTVAAASGVSKAFLYKEPDIKARVEKLRQKYTGTKKLPVKQRASDASKDAMIRTLKDRIKRLEADNKELRRQNEVQGGQALLAGELRQKLARCEAENERLKKREPAPEMVTTVLEHPRKIEAQLSFLGVKMNATLQKLINETPTNIVQEAITALREAKVANHITNSAGFLNKAIREAWQPNEGYEAKVELEQFNEWYTIAKEKGLVIGSQQIEGVLYVVKPDGECVAFGEILNQHPIKILLAAGVLDEY